MIWVYFPWEHVIAWIPCAQGEFFHPFPLFLSAFSDAGGDLTCRLTLVCQDYTHLCWDLASYFLWPFGKYMVRYADPTDASHQAAMTTSAGEKIPLVGHSSASSAAASDQEESEPSSAPEESKSQERRARTVCVVVCGGLRC